MTMTTTIKPIACSNTNPVAIKAAAQFPKRLHEVHEGRIIPADDANYSGNRKPINVVCTVCGHEWSPVPSALLNHGNGCPECYRQRCIASAGKLRTPNASAEEKAYGKYLREEKNWTYKRIADFLGRSTRTIRYWLDPVQQEKHRQTSRERFRENSEYMRANARRYKVKFEHGREANRASGAKYRALKMNAISDVLIDGVWHTINMYQQMKGSAYVKENFSAADKAWKELTTRAEKLSKIAGVTYHVDHLVPLNRGGLHCPTNFALRPAKENLSKQDKLIDYDLSLNAKRIFGMLPGYDQCVCRI